jgi:polyisoprenyl-teichoic acid--peptidoglycan teichoic acid transferase
MTHALRRHPLVTAAIAVPLAIVIGFATLFALWLHGVRLPYASGSTWFTVTKTAAADYTPAPGAPVFIIGIGNDGRPGEGGGTRGDAIHLIGVNPTTHQATILDFPRDLGMAIPGHGTDKVNTSHVYGGAALQAQTIGNAVGVKIPYAIDTDFAGFVDMVNDMGGITVNVPEAMDDDDSAAHFPAGPLHMDGPTALAFGRNRHQFPTGDLKRSENQGYFIIQTLAQLRAQNTGPVGTLKYLAILGRHAQLDGIGLNDLYALSRLGLSIDPANVRNVVVPISVAGGTELRLGPGAASLFQDFADDAVLQSH